MRERAQEVCRQPPRSSVSYMVKSINIALEIRKCKEFYIFHAWRKVIVNNCIIVNIIQNIHLSKSLNKIAKEVNN